MASPPSLKRLSGSETLRYLQERTEQLRKSQEEDAKLKKEELALRKASGWHANQHASYDTNYAKFTTANGPSPEHATTANATADATADATKTRFLPWLTN